MSEEYRKLWHDRIDAFVENGEIDCIDTILMEALATLMLSGKLATKLKAKFDRGMAEHGLGFENVDFDAEIENEVLDICNYLIGKHYATDQPSHTPETKE